MSRIRWGRVIGAAVLSELGVFAALFAAIAAYSLVTPTFSAAESGDEVGYYVAPAAGAIMTLLATLWATRRLTSAVVLHGVLIGVVSVILTAGFIFTARPEHRVMYVISFGLRLAAGSVGGVIAQRMSTARTTAASLRQPA